MFCVSVSISGDVAKDNQCKAMDLTQDRGKDTAFDENKGNESIPANWKEGVSKQRGMASSQGKIGTIGMSASVNGCVTFSIRTFAFIPPAFSLISFRSYTCISYYTLFRVTVLSISGDVAKDNQCKAMDLTQDRGKDTAFDENKGNISIPANLKAGVSDISSDEEQNRLDSDKPDTAMFNALSSISDSMSGAVAKDSQGSDMDFFDDINDLDRDINDFMAPTTSIQDLPEWALLAPLPPEGSMGLQDLSDEQFAKLKRMMCKKWRCTAGLP